MGESLPLSAPIMLFCKQYPGSGSGIEGSYLTRAWYSEKKNHVMITPNRNAVIPATKMSLRSNGLFQEPGARPLKSKLRSMEAPTMAEIVHAKARIKS